MELILTLDETDSNPYLELTLTLSWILWSKIRNDHSLKKFAIRLPGPFYKLIGGQTSE